MYRFKHGILTLNHILSRLYHFFYNSLGYNNISTRKTHGKNQIGYQHLLVGRKCSL